MVLSHQPLKVISNMDTSKEEKLVLRRFLDLSNTAYYKNIPVFTDFLNLNEQSILAYAKHDLPHIPYQGFGGYPDAERKIICFCSDFDTYMQEEQSFYPISCIKICPLHEKYSDDLSHRDYLGAILNLGIDRSKLGDILIKDHIGFVFCINSIAEFLCEHIVKIKHTFVSTSIVTFDDVVMKPKQIEVTGTVASERLDCLVAFAFNSSRSSMQGLIPGGKVFVNSKLILSESYLCKEDDIISVRGYGKFTYVGSNKVTKKGRLSVTIRKYDS